MGVITTSISSSTGTLGVTGSVSLSGSGASGSTAIYSSSYGHTFYSSTGSYTSGSSGVTEISGGCVYVTGSSPAVVITAGDLIVSGNCYLGDSLTDIVYIRSRVTASEGVSINLDNRAVTVGASQDLLMYHDGASSYLKNNTGHIIIDSNATDKDIRLKLGEDNSDVAVKIRNNSNDNVWACDGSGNISGSGTQTTHGDLTANSNIIQGSGRQYIFQEFIVRAADSTDNTVIAEFGSKIPQYAVVTRVALVVKTASNLSTHIANIRFGTVSGRSADTDISGESFEVLGAGASGTRSSDNTSGAEDIDLKNDPKEVWINQDLGFMTADVYPYLCNAGTGNGTTNSSAGTVIAYIEWIGLD